jgi:ABC-type Mn2+/Zn2+ transport system ATPase subunit
MRNFTVQLMNYRCFSGQTPTTWSFNGEALTSFVGPNNAGKSTFLRLFYELRPVFRQLQQQSLIGQFVTQKNIGLMYDGVGDPAEIPNFHSAEPVVLDFSISEDLEAHDLSRVRLTMNRATSGWAGRVWTGPTQVELNVQPGQGFPGQVSTPRGMVPVQTSKFANFMESLISRTLYVPAYRNLINQGGGIYYDITVGQDFVKTWDLWKGGDKVEQRRTILNILADIKDVFGFSELNAEATPGKDTLQITVDGRSERIRELGAGLSQFIMVLGNVAMKKPEILFIDEPELNLHPALQTKFLSALAKYTTHIVYASHSIGLARAAEHVYSVTRVGETSTIKQLPATRSYAELMGEMSFAAYQELGFEQILCVEGIHDVLAIQQFLRLLRLDQKIVVIPLGGSAFINPNTAPQLSELTRITSKVGVLIDSEKSAAAQPLCQAREGFVNVCQSLGITVHVTVRRAFEHYLTDAAVKKAKGPGFRALQPYEDFNTFPQAWSKDENWRIAQHMTAADLVATDIGVWLKGLNGAVKP